MKALLAIYAIATLSDYATTAWGLARGGIERNPFAASLIVEHGVEALLWFKIVGIVIMAVSIWSACKLARILADALEDERFYVGLRWFAFGWFYLLTLLQWLVVGSNYWQIRLYLGL